MTTNVTPSTPVLPQGWTIIGTYSEPAFGENALYRNASGEIVWPLVGEALDSDISSDEWICGHDSPSLRLELENTALELDGKIDWL